MSNLVNVTQLSYGLVCVTYQCVAGESVSCRAVPPFTGSLRLHVEEQKRRDRGRVVGAVLLGRLTPSPPQRNPRLPRFVGRAGRCPHRRQRRVVVCSWRCWHESLTTRDLIAHYAALSCSPPRQPTHSTFCSPPTRLGLDWQLDLWLSQWQLFLNSSDSANSLTAVV